MKSQEELKAQGQLPFKDFIRKFWDVAVPTNKLIENWHIDIISEHLVAAYRREIKKLAINIYYRSSKSSIVSVLFPSWVWTLDPKETFLTASFASDLALRDAGYMIDLVQSPEYQALYGDKVEIRQDRSAVSKFYNTQGGYRTSVGSGAQITGLGGSIRIFDDPNTPDETEEQRTTTNSRFDNKWESRFTSQDDVSIIVQQRTDVNDLTGHVVEKELGFEVLKIPLRYEGKKYFETSLKLEDPRTVLREIADKNRFTDEFWVKEEKRLGINANAQLQQNPALTNSLWFSREPKRVQSLPNRLLVARYWDKAFTLEGGAFSVGALLGFDPEVLDTIVIHIVRGQWDEALRDDIIKQTAEKDNAWFNNQVFTYIEREPGATGRDSCEILIKMLRKHYVEADLVTGDKEYRARGFNSQWQAGNVHLYDGELGVEYFEGKKGGIWIPDYLRELRGFPRGKYKDQVDASTGSYNKLQLLPVM